MCYKCGRKRRTQNKQDVEEHFLSHLNKTGHENDTSDKGEAA